LLYIKSEGVLFSVYKIYIKMTDAGIDTVLQYYYPCTRDAIDSLLGFGRGVHVLSKLIDPVKPTQSNQKNGSDRIIGWV
jgi:hypothetical protein